MMWASDRHEPIKDWGSEVVACRICGFPFRMFFGGPSNCNRPDCGRDDKGEIEECYKDCKTWSIKWHNENREKWE